MIQWKSNYTGSTEQKVSGSNPTSINNQVGKNHALTTQSEPHSSEVSNYGLKIKETINSDSSNLGLKKENRDLIVSTTLQAKGYS